MIEWEGALKRMYQKKVVNSNKCWESSGKARVPHSSGKGYPVIRIKVEGGLGELEDGQGNGIYS